jgi:hypothetical protein
MQDIKPLFSLFKKTPLPLGLGNADSLFGSENSRHTTFWFS